LGLFKFPGRKNDIIQDKQKRAVTDDPVQDIEVPVDKDVFRGGYIEMEGIEKIDGQGQDMEDGNNPDNQDEFFCPLLVFKYRIIYKNPDIEKGYELGNIIDVNDYIKKPGHETAGPSFDEKIKQIADH
jgi:hypothetical protein